MHDAKGRGMLSSPSKKGGSVSAEKKESLQDRVLAMRGKVRSEGEAGEDKPPVRPPKKCKLTLEEFVQHATDLVVVLEGQPRVLGKKVFSSGSFGWNTSEKMDFMVNGQPIRCQVSVIITAIGSKPGQETRE